MILLAEQRRCPGVSSKPSMSSSCPVFTASHEVDEADRCVSRRGGRRLLRLLRWLEDAVPLENGHELHDTGRARGELLDDALGIAGDEPSQRR
jgi:hypothetical protein